MFHMSFTYVLHARPLRICIRAPSSAPIDRGPGGFWDSAKLLGAFLGHRDEVTLQFGEKYIKAPWKLSSNWSAISGQQLKLGEWDLLIGMCPISVDSKFGEVVS